MTAFVIFVNGCRARTVEISSEHSCGVHLSSIGGGSDALILFHVGGVHGGERVEWSVPELKVGDEITIKIAECEATDQPDKRQPYQRMDRG